MTNNKQARNKGNLLVDVCTEIANKIDNKCGV